MFNPDSAAEDFLSMKVDKNFLPCSEIGFLRQTGFLSWSKKISRKGAIKKLNAKKIPSQSALEIQPVPLHRDSGNHLSPYFFI